MYSENEPKSGRFVNRQFITLGVIIVAIIIMAICAFVILSLRRLTAPSPTPTPEIVMVNIPAAVPANNYTVRLPAVLSGYVPVSGPASVPLSAVVTEPVWIVMRINRLAYELDGRRYDLATFRRVDSEETVKAYCLNRGWERPDIGTEYLLNANGVFIPLNDSDVDPIQRFQLLE